MKRVGRLQQLTGGFFALAALAVSFSVTLHVTRALADEATDALARALKDRISTLTPGLERPDDQQALDTFYSERGYQPVFFDANSATRAASVLLDELSNSAQWGLKPGDFAVSTIDPAARAKPRTPQEIAEAEIEFDAALLRYARHARGARIMEPERQLSDFIDRRPELPAPLDVIRSLAIASDPVAALRSYHPSHPQFAKLQQKLAQLIAPARPNGGIRLPLSGGLLVPGQTADEVALLRKRLDVPADGDPRYYDDALRRAVRAFQKSARLRIDGLVGNVTRRALNGDRRNNGDNIDAIVATMEQWRWMPRHLGDRHLLVNVPAASVDYISDGEIVASDRVIVGKPKTPTPTFSHKMVSIVLRPLWALPDSIKREKINQAARRGRSLESLGIVVKKGRRTVKSWSVDWSKADLSFYSFVQPSGDGNALGDVKFLFPNKHNVYLHDTPQRSLFQSSERFYSHGCIRLRNPLDMAKRLFDADFGEGVHDVDQMMADGPDNNEIFLQRPLDIHVGYFSAWVEDDGSISYHGDPYGHDERITLALAGKWDEIDKGPSHKAEPEAIIASRTPADAAAGLPKPRRSFKATAITAFPAPGKKPKIPGKAFATPVARRGHTVGDLMNSVFAR